MKLSPHFTLAEFTISDYAIRHNLNNTPHSDVIENLKMLAAKMEEVRLIVGHPLIITSGYRSRDVNRGIGGSPTSDHMEGLAADFYPLRERHKLLSVARKIAKALPEYDQLILEPHVIHIGIGPRMRRETLTIKQGQAPVKGLVA